MTEVWWHPREIKFNKAQCLWLIPQLPRLREGTYPTNPVGTGYTDAPAKRSLKYRAYFETPCQIAGELDYRLSKTGVDGKLLVAEVMAEYTELSYEAVRALNYVSGWRRKGNYGQWKRQRRYRGEALLSR